MAEPFETPRCDKCGAPVTTGAMAILCQHGQDCPLWNPAVEEFKADWRDPPAEES